MSLRSPLSKAIGLGSAGHGFSHWWWQRVTAIALIPLSIWFAVSVLSLVGADYVVARNWLAAPINATILFLFVVTALYHAQTGLQVVIEDYVHTKWLNLSLLLLIKFAAVALSVYVALAVIKVVLGA